MREASERVAVRRDEGLDPVELELADRRVPAPDQVAQVVGRRRRREVDLLERAVDGITDLGRVQARLAPSTGPHGTGFIPATRSA